MKPKQNQVLQLGRMIAAKEGAPTSHKVVLGVVAVGWLVSPIDDALFIALGPAVIVDELFLIAAAVATHTHRYAEWHHTRKVRKRLKDNPNYLVKYQQPPNQ